MTSSGWDSKEAFPWSRNASFAHDSGGVGTALLIAAGLAEDPEMVDGWRGAWEFENTFKLDEGWDDARYPETTYSTNWCHGLAGIALARIVWLQTIHGSAFLEKVVSASEIAQIRSELDEASGILMRALHDCGSPSLCHGIAGGAWCSTPQGDCATGRTGARWLTTSSPAPAPHFLALPARGASTTCVTSAS